MAEEAITLILEKEAIDNVRVRDVMNKIDEIQVAAGGETIKVGRSALERTIREIVAHLKKKAPSKKEFSGDSDVIVKNNRNRRI